MDSIIHPCEWVIQFDNDTPIPIAETTDEQLNETVSELKIHIPNTNNSCFTFSDNNGKTFKIFVRKKNES